MVPTTSQSQPMSSLLLVACSTLNYIPIQRTLMTIGSCFRKIPHYYTATHPHHTTHVNIDDIEISNLIKEIYPALVPAGANKVINP